MNTKQKNEAHPAFGPVPVDVMAAALCAPAGQAAKLIRPFVPPFQRKEGEVVRWKVKAKRDITQTGVAYVEAATKDEAEDLADALGAADFDWDDDMDWGFDTESVEPCTEARAP